MNIRATIEAIFQRLKDGVEEEFERGFFAETNKPIASALAEILAAIEEHEKEIICREYRVELPRLGDQLAEKVEKPLPTCKTCRYWKDESEGLGIKGQCLAVGPLGSIWKHEPTFTDPQFACTRWKPLKDEHGFPPCSYPGCTDPAGSKVDGKWYCGPHSFMVANQVPLAR